MNQTSLFDQTAPHNRTETSIEAAIEIQDHIGNLQQLVLNAVKESVNGLTRDELSDVLEIPTATVCGRCNELVKMGKIGSLSNLKVTKNGSHIMEKIKRPTKSGRKAEVLFFYSATPKQKH